MKWQERGGREHWQKKAQKKDNYLLLIRDVYCSYVNFFFADPLQVAEHKANKQYKIHRPQGELKVKSQKQTSPHPHLERKKNVYRWQVFDVNWKKAALLLRTARTDGSYLSALWGQADCWSSACLPGTFADIILPVEDSRLAFIAVLSSVIASVSSFHTCCISAGLRQAKRWLKTQSLSILLQIAK